MRLAKLITAVILLFTGIQTYGQEDSTKEKFKTVEIKTEILCSHFQTCETGYTNVYYTIKRETKGVRKINVNPETNTITVKYRTDKTNLAEIKEAITLAGFKANDLPPNEEAYAKLDGCCKGGSH
jgi:copper chaperone CopZ